MKTGTQAPSWAPSRDVALDVDQHPGVVLGRLVVWHSNRSRITSVDCVVYCVLAGPGWCQSAVGEQSHRTEICSHLEVRGGGQSAGLVGEWAFHGYD